MLAAPIPKAPPSFIPEDIKPIATTEEVKPEALAVEASEKAFIFPTVLAELSNVDRLLVTKRLRIKDVLFMRGKKNRFSVRTPDENLIFSIEEENRWWVGYLCYGLRPLQLRVSNINGLVVMTINRPYACTSRVLPCQLQALEVFSPPGQLIGTVQQQWTALKPLYVVSNDRGHQVFTIRGPTMTLSFFRDVHFQIQGADGSQIGTISKRWQGLTHALFFAPVFDRFTVTFERSLSVEEKAMLMAISLLMDYMYYDS